MAIERLKSAEKNIKTDSKPLKIAQKCSKLLKIAQKCSKMLKNVKKCSKLLKIAQNCSKSRNQVSTIDSQVAIIIN